MDTLAERLQKLTVWSKTLESLEQSKLSEQCGEINSKLREIVRLKSEVVVSKDGALKQQCDETIGRIRILRQLSKELPPSSVIDDEKSEEGVHPMESTTNNKSPKHCILVNSNHGTEKDSNTIEEDESKSSDQSPSVDSSRQSSIVAPLISEDDSKEESKIIVNEKEANTKQTSVNKLRVIRMDPNRPVCAYGSDCVSQDSRHYFDEMHFAHKDSHRMIAKYLKSNGLVLEGTTVTNTTNHNDHSHSQTATSLNDQSPELEIVVPLTDEKETSKVERRNRTTTDDDGDDDGDFNPEEFARKEKEKNQPNHRSLGGINSGGCSSSSMSKSNGSSMNSTLMNNSLSETVRKERLDLLLKKTESYMKQITRRVRKGQKQSAGGRAGGASTVASCAEVREFLAGGETQESMIDQTDSLEGGTLKDYQKIGLKWMVSLNQLRLNGILADEMGLGKTVQIMALFAWLLDTQGVDGIHLVVVPLSTLSGWKEHFETWLPSLYVYVHSGEREERRGMLKHIRRRDQDYTYNVVLTTYERAVVDESELAKFKFHYLIVDEAHRLKNSQSRLFGALNACSCRFRLLLTGTPLQNNLQELWSLLNFILPLVFDSKQSFEDWFCLPSMSVSGGFQTRKSKKKKKKTKNAKKVSIDELVTDEERLMIIDRLHRAINPFVLRRLKKDVLPGLAKKQEIMVKCPMSGMQYAMYECLQVFGGLCYRFNPNKPRIFCNILPKLRKVSNHPLMLFDFERGLVIDDDKKQTDEKEEERQQHKNAADESELIEKVCHLSRDIVRTSGKMMILDNLLNKMLISDHRVLVFFQFLDAMDIVSEYLSMKNIKFVRIDGTMSSESRIEALEIFDRSQSVAPSESLAKSKSLSRSISPAITQHMPHLRHTLDQSSSSSSSSSSSISDPNNNNDNNDDDDSEVHVFLLSTRSCGLGLNLYSADTVILFDSDWNPQADLQAMARVHRIGQEKEVRIFRLIAASSIEEEIFNRAQSRLDLEKSAIDAGQFNFEKDISLEHRKSFLDEISQKRIKLKDFIKQFENSQSDQSNRELNRLFARNEDEIRLFDEIDSNRQSIADDFSKLQRDICLPDWLVEMKSEEERRQIERDNLPEKRHRKLINYCELNSDDDTDESFIFGKVKTEAVKRPTQKKRVKRKRSDFEAENEQLTSSLLGLTVVNSRSGSPTSDISIDVDTSLKKRRTE